MASEPHVGKQCSIDKLTSFKSYLLNIDSIQVHICKYFRNTYAKYYFFFN